MKIKKNSDKEVSLFDVIAKEKYLLVFILIVSILFTVSLHYKESSKFQEIITKVFLEPPNVNNELFYLSSVRSGYTANIIFQDSLFC